MAAVGVVDAAKALALVVCIDSAGVRVPGVAATKMDVGRPPLQKVAQWSSRISMEDRRCRAELDLWKKRKKTKKKPLTLLPEFSSR